MAEALVVSGLDCFYGDVQVLHGLSLSLTRGEVLCLLGRNGAGKTTTLKAIMGLVPARGGTIKLGKRELTQLPAHEVPRAGVAYVPGAPFYASELGAGELRLSFSHLGEADLAEAGRRLASVIRAAA